MIISASYKTDIPTFYGEWFMNRLRAGSCKMINPYSKQVYTVDLTRGSIDGIVFWTKNIGPFLKYLPEVQERGYPFIVQHTINGYPHELEFRVINYNRTVEYMKELADTYGPHVAVWRYDPIIISSLTPVEWHLRNFEALARSLAGVTDEVVISFAQIYQKTKRNMDWAANEYGFDWKELHCLTKNLTQWLEYTGSAPCWQVRHGRLSMDHFFSPLILEGFKQIGSDLAHPALEGADLQRLIASRGAAL